MYLNEITATIAEPITLNEAKAHLKMDGIDADDTLITAIISAARDVAEQELDRDIVERTWEYYLDRFPMPASTGYDIPLPRSPAKSVTAITYVDVDGAEQTVSTDVYSLQAAAAAPLIYLNYQQSWPATREQRNAVKITYTTGYDAIPDSIRQAILLLIGDLYEHRTSSVIGLMVSPTLHTARALLAPHRRLTV